MLHSLSVENFFSFRDRKTLSLLGCKSVRNDERFYQTRSGVLLAKTMALFGANASGKTNFLKAFSFINWFLFSSWSQQGADSPIPFTPFLFAEENLHPTQFEVVVESTDGTYYVYTLSITRSSVLHESLKVRNLEDKRTRSLFVRDNEVYRFSSRDKLTKTTVPKSLRRRNASFIAAAKQTDYSGFDDFLRNIRFVSNVSMLGRLDVPESDLKLLHDNAELRKAVAAILNDCDTGIESLEIDKIDAHDNIAIQRILSAQQEILKSIGVDDNRTLEDLEVYTAKAVHSIDGKKYKIPLDHESNGTRQVIRVLPLILTTLQTGGVLVYDELEYGIHPLLLPVLIRLFYSEDKNPLGAQLIFSCHSPLVMDYLNKYQIVFTEKMITQESDLFRLSDFDRVRNDDNYLNKYLSGAYGAVPEL